MAATVFLWSNTDRFVKNLDEITRRRKSAGKRSFGNRNSLVQHIFRFFNPGGGYIFTGRHSQSGAETADERRTADEKVFGYRVEGQLFGVMFVYVEADFM